MCEIICIETIMSDTPPPATPHTCTDHIMCGVHFTDQQYEYDPVSGDVTVEWEGTGPDETNAVSEFKCKIDNEALQNCEYMHEINGDIVSVCMYNYNAFILFTQCMAMEFFLIYFFELTF